MLYESKIESIVLKDDGFYLKVVIATDLQIFTCDKITTNCVGMICMHGIRKVEDRIFG